jgi:hypothetical protein
VACVSVLASTGEEAALRFLIALIVGGGLIVYGMAAPPPFAGIMLWPVLVGAAVVLLGAWLELRGGRSV